MSSVIAGRNGGIAASVLFDCVVVPALTVSAFAGALVTMVKGPAASLKITHSAAAVAALLLDHFRFMHALSFATALPAEYAAFLAQLKWANLAVIASPFSTSGSGRCKPPGSASSAMIWRRALELMDIASPEAYFVSVAVLVGGLLVGTFALNALASFCFACVFRRPLPATWSLPRLQASLLLGTHSPVSLACVLILASAGCSRAYTAAACAVLACVPCTLIVWVLVAIRSVTLRADGAGIPLVEWTSPAAHDPERVRVAGEWQHRAGTAGAAGARLKLRLGAVFIQRKGGLLAHLPLDIALQTARNVLMICAPGVGLLLAGGMLLALECTN
jgi:hypothetical protein